jgi:hypothetical protein
MSAEPMPPPAPKTTYTAGGRETCECTEKSSAGEWCGDQGSAAGCGDQGSAAGVMIRNGQRWRPGCDGASVLMQGLAFVLVLMPTALRMAAGCSSSGAVDCWCIEGACQCSQQPCFMVAAWPGVQGGSMACNLQAAAEVATLLALDALCTWGVTCTASGSHGTVKCPARLRSTSWRSPLAVPLASEGGHRAGCWYAA